MDFYSNQLFHIYNQGNNKQQIFFCEENYQYFLWKMRVYLLPFGDFVAYCLMPNHFHWQFFVKKVEVKRSVLRTHMDKTEWQWRKWKFGQKARPFGKAQTRVAKGGSLVSLNEAIGMLQKAYTRAIHESKGSSGSLFRKPCKAKDGWIDEFITLKKANGKLDYRFCPGNDYAYQCFCYIHNNPKEAGLVDQVTDWRYSSAKDYAGLRNGTLCNLEMGRELKNCI